MDTVFASGKTAPNTKANGETALKKALAVWVTQMALYLRVISRRITRMVKDRKASLMVAYSWVLS